MVESTPVSYDVSFEMKKHFTPQEITGNIRSFITSLRVAANVQTLRRG